MVIIEDDYDHEFHYDGRPVLPLASADRAGLVVYIGTLSKILAPGLRVGYIVAPPAVLHSVAAIRSLLDMQGDQATEAAIATLIEDGELQRHVARVRRVYANRRDILAASLRQSVWRRRRVRDACRRNGDVGAFAEARRRRGVGAPRHPAWGVVVHRAAGTRSTASPSRLRDSALPG